MDSADFDALEERARQKLSPGAYAFAAGGADDEITLADNLAAWRRLRLRPRRKIFLFLATTLSRSKSSRQRAARMCIRGLRMFFPLLTTRS